MEKEKNLLEEKKWENIEEWWEDVMSAYKDGNGIPNEVQGFFLARPNFNKMPGEDELFKWLKDEIGEDLLEVELNEKGIIVAKKLEDKN